MDTSALRVIEGAIVTIALLDWWGYPSLILGGQVFYYHPMPPLDQMFRKKKKNLVFRTGWRGHPQLDQSARECEDFSFHQPMQVIILSIPFDYRTLG